jgi:hypothetical protein
MAVPVKAGADERCEVLKQHHHSQLLFHFVT